MDEIINKIIKKVRRDKIKVITISEPNHRSVTSHIFQFNLLKRLYNEKLFDTFSSERLGIFDDIVMNYYLKNKLKIKILKNKVFFGGMGTKRWFDFFAEKDYSSYKLVGLEGDEYKKNIIKNLPRKLLEDNFSPQFLEDLNNNTTIENIRAIKEKDILVKESMINLNKNSSSREKFWLRNIKKILKERGNLFINGFHLGKEDIIGKFLKKEYGEKCLILSMSAYNIKTQVLTLDSDNTTDKKIASSIIAKDYKREDKNIISIAPPSPYEEYLYKKYKDWKMIKVTSQNKNKTIRRVGCYLAITEKELENKEKLNEVVEDKLKFFDYVIFFKTSTYKEDMLI